MIPAVDQETVLVQIRIPRDLMRKLDHFRIDHDLFRARATELILEAGLARIAAERAGGVDS